MNKHGLAGAWQSAKAVVRWLTMRCPDQMDLAAYYDGRLEENRRLRLESHMADCQRCSTTLALLTRSEDASGRLEIPPSLVAKARELVGNRKPVLAQSWRWAPLVCAVALVAMVSWVHVETRKQSVESGVPAEAREEHRQPGPTQPAVATPPPAASTASRQVRSSPSQRLPLQLIVPREGQTIAASVERIAWTALPKALFYEVEVVSEDGTLIWQHRVEQTTVVMPARPELQTGVRCFASVRAHLSNGRVLKSRAVGFLFSTHN